MVICKFFLQGTCKFGQNCRYEHALTDKYHYQNPSSNSVLRQPTFGASTNVFLTGNKPAQGPSNTIDTNTIVKTVTNEVIAAEKGGQWLLSYYAPFKEKPAFPGLEDICFEEVRLGFYEAQKNGTTEQYKRHIQEMMQARVVQIKALQNPSPDIVNILIAMYETSPSPLAGIFNPTAAVNRTGGFNTSQNSIFVNKNTGFGQNSFNQQQNASVFGQKSTFGINQQTGFNQQNGGSIFANQGTPNNTFTQQTSIFGGQNTTPFTSAQPSNSIFASPVSASPFSNPNAATSSNNTNIFAQAAANFPTQPQPQNQQTSIFGGSNIPVQSGSIFAGQPSQQTSIFNTTQPQQSQNIFAQQVQQPQQTFAPLQNNPTPFLQNNPIFGGPAFNPGNNFAPGINNPPAQNVFGNTAVRNMNDIDMTIYSKIEELTQDEINWFQSDSLDIMSIPEKPPTFDMCFGK